MRPRAIDWILFQDSQHSRDVLRELRMPLAMTPGQAIEPGCGSNAKRLGHRLGMPLVLDRPLRFLFGAQFLQELSCWTHPSRELILAALLNEPLHLRIP